MQNLCCDQKETTLLPKWQLLQVVFTSILKRVYQKYVNIGNPIKGNIASTLTSFQYGCNLTLYRVWQLSTKMAIITDTTPLINSFRHCIIELSIVTGQMYQVSMSFRQSNLCMEETKRHLTCQQGVVQTVQICPVGITKYH